MDQLLKNLKLVESITSVVSIWQVIFGTLLCAALTMLVGMVYRHIHSEGSYSQSMVHTFILAGMVTSLIMIIIGSNIARAFSLVGALSIIRFRTAIKSPLDVTFVFLSIAVGMACGTGFYAVAMVGTVIMLSVMFLLYHYNFGSAPARKEFLLSVQFHLNVDYENVLNPLLGKFFEAYSISYVETIRQGTLREVVYTVRPKKDVSDQKIVNAVTQINDNLKVSYRVIRNAIEVS